MKPTLILHGEADDVVPVSEAYKLECLLKRNAVKYQMEIFQGQTHWFDTTAQFVLLMRCAGFLQRYLPAERSCVKPADLPQMDVFPPVRAGRHPT